MANDKRRALVLFSGGQDSTVCLAYALDRYEHVETIGFDHGERRGIEGESRRQVRSHLRAQFPRWAPRLGSDHSLDLRLLDQIADTAPTPKRESEMNAGGLDTAIMIDTPLMWLEKAETWAMTERLGGEPLIELVVEHTHSCYLGDREHRHPWGYGCGMCPSCDLRRKGYDTWLAS